MKMNRKGFTLVEIMIVVAIIGILAAIAIPNFVKSRKESQKNACLANLKQIEGAFEQCKLAGNTPADVAALVDVGDTKTTGYLKVLPVCPAGGTYSLPTDTTRATCNAAVTPAHVLP